MADRTPKEEHYALIQKPIMTEKSTKLQYLRNQYTFRVAPHANKREIKKAVEDLFEVHVEDVNVVNVPGKIKRILGRPGRTSGWRKALVKIREGESIEIV